MNQIPKILVVGSFVMDLIVSAEKFPNAGETVIGCGFATAPGGKGANQAIQAARLGASVSIAGKVGKDAFGKTLLESADKSGVDTSMVQITEDAPSAVGNVQIQVTEQGTENRIIVVPGANMQITADDIAALENRISEFDFVILQNEIPMPINEMTARFAHKAGVPVMLNPAPSSKISDNLISCLTYISPNEHEAADLTGVSLKDEQGINQAIVKLHRMGIPNVLITLGERGCVFSNGKESFKSKSVDCGKVVDPTAAGDSFIGAFCTAAASGVPVEEALRFANCAAGITVSRMGAQTSLPTLQEVLSVMKANGFNRTPFQKLQKGS